MSRRMLVLTVLAGAAAVTAALTLVVALLDERTAGDASPLSAINPYRGSQPGARIKLPDFSLRDFRGRIVRSDDLRGRVALVTFLDSQCRESCPLIASQVGATLRTLGGGVRRQVIAVAITTDPAEDTPASVRSFLRRTRALGSLNWLGGGESAAKLRRIWKAFYVYSSLQSGKDAVHSAPVRIYTRDGVWAATLHPGADLTVDNLAHDIKTALAGQT